MYDLPFMECTLEELAVLELIHKNPSIKLYLASHNEVFWHDEKPEEMTVMETRQAATRAEVYISSVNAISMDGVIVNIDNTGNRVAAISFRTDKVFLVIGANKITEDYDSALFKARNVAAPKNAKRLNRKTSCALTGDKCYDCKSHERICRNLSVLWNRPTGIEYYVILINKELGYKILRRLIGCIVICSFQFAKKRGF